MSLNGNPLATQKDIFHMANSQQNTFCCDLRAGCTFHARLWRGSSGDEGLGMKLNNFLESSCRCAFVHWTHVVHKNKKPWEKFQTSQKTSSKTGKGKLGNKKLGVLLFRLKGLPRHRGWGLVVFKSSHERPRSGCSGSVQTLGLRDWSKISALLPYQSNERIILPSCIGIIS